MLSQGSFCSIIHDTTHLTYGCKSTDMAESQYNQFKCMRMKTHSLNFKTLPSWRIITTYLAENYNNFNSLNVTLKSMDIVLHALSVLNGWKWH